MDCTVCKHPGGESRGFGFVTFSGKGEGPRVRACEGGWTQREGRNVWERAERCGRKVFEAGEVAR